MEHRFGAAPPGTLGIEEELFFVGAESFEVASGYSQVVGEPDGRFKPELFESLVELTTPVVPDAVAALTELRRLRAEIAERAGGRGLAIHAAGSHAHARGVDQTIVPVERYARMVASIGDGIHRQLVCGLHVHVSMQDPETCLRAYEGVVRWLPDLLALSANSPFAEGEDTGRRSERAVRLLEMPTGGTPPILRNWDDWEAATGRDATRRHWDAWPRPEYGTLEVRVMDMQTDVRRSAGFAAIIRALALTARADEPYDRELYALRRDEATRLPADAGPIGDAIELADEELELARLVLEGPSEAELQLEAGIDAAPRDVAQRTVAFG